MTTILENQPTLYTLKSSFQLVCISLNCVLLIRRLSCAPWKWSCVRRCYDF